jgi:hypothetical protein
MPIGATWAIEIKVQDLGIRIDGLLFRVKGLGLRA